MTHYFMRKTVATPLDDEAIGDLIEEGWDEQLVVVDGVTYDGDDLHQCSSCLLFFPDPNELDEDEFLDALCEDCLVEAREEAEAQRDLESWARWACR